MGKKGRDKSFLQREGKNVATDVAKKWIMMNLSLICFERPMTELKQTLRMEQKHGPRHLRVSVLFCSGKLQCKRHNANLLESKAECQSYEGGGLSPPLIGLGEAEEGGGLLSSHEY